MNFLKSRKEELLAIAMRERVENGVAKSAAIATILAGMLFYSSSPLAPVGLFLGLLSYISAQIIDCANCNSINLLPFIRGNALSLIGAMGHSSARRELLENYNELEQLKLYLNPMESKELDLLCKYENELDSYLEGVDTLQIQETYNWIVSKYFIEGRLELNSLPAPEKINEKSILEGLINELPMDSCNPKSSKYLVAESIRDELINRAFDRVLNGCLVLAAPGSGKTTFLNTIWINLHQIYQERFLALFVVMRTEDVNSYQKIADTYLCKNNPRKTCAEIIKFIDKNMRNTNKVCRIFFDDYLSCQELLRNSLKGCMIDLDSYEIFDSKKEGKDNGAINLAPAYEIMMARLNEAWFVGREYNLSLFISSHSLNIQDLEFISSSSGRSVGNFIILARQDRDDFIRLALHNSFLISDKQKRELLLAELNSTPPTKEPIMLANYQNWQLGIIPASFVEEAARLKT